MLNQSRGERHLLPYVVYAIIGILVGAGIYLTFPFPSGTVGAATKTYATADDLRRLKAEYATALARQQAQLSATSARLRVIEQRLAKRRN